jgi:hypothetical protein
VLDDLLAALMLEIDIDVGRLVALAAHETLEEHVDALGIDRLSIEERLQVAEAIWDSVVHDVEALLAAGRTF